MKLERGAKALLENIQNGARVFRYDGRRFWRVINPSGIKRNAFDRSVRDLVSAGLVEIQRSDSQQIVVTKV